MVVIIRQLIEEGSRLEDERGQDDFGEIHAGAHLLHQEPDEALVIIGQLLRQLANLRHENENEKR